MAQRQEQGRAKPPPLPLAEATQDPLNLLNPLNPLNPLDPLNPLNPLNPLLFGRSRLLPGSRGGGAFESPQFDEVCSC